LKEEVRRYIEKAEKSIKVAKDLLKNGYYEDACSKAYYVMFYSAQALLKNSEINVTKHSAVVAKFGEYFVKTGEIETKYHKYLIDAKRKREISDYDVFIIIDRETAEERVKWAEEFLKKIKEILYKES